MEDAETSNLTEGTISMSLKIRPKALRRSFDRRAPGVLFRFSFVVYNLKTSILEPKRAPTSKEEFLPSGIVGWESSPLLSEDRAATYHQ